MKTVKELLESRDSDAIRHALRTLTTIKTKIYHEAENEIELATLLAQMIHINSALTSLHIAIALKDRSLEQYSISLLT